MEKGRVVEFSISLPSSHRVDYIYAAVSFERGIRVRILLTSRS